MDIVIVVAILVDLPFFMMRNVNGFSIVLHLTIMSIALMAVTFNISLALA